MAFTFFFRDMQIFELAVKHVVPVAIGRSRPKIWAAGCAMGPEPYSVAIFLAEKTGYFGFKNLFICATDVDETDTFGDIVRSGEYPEEDLMGIPENVFKKYFKQDGKAGYCRIIDTIRERVIFRKHDLLSLQLREVISVLSCARTSSIIFDATKRMEVMKAFHGSLAPGGFFATEQTQKIFREIARLFEQVACKGQIFRKVEVQGRV